MPKESWQPPQVALTVDLAILTVREDALQILLIERGIVPYRGKLALPGGFIASTKEDIDDAAVRELTEETGLNTDHMHLEQLRTYGAPKRDPRGRVVTVCYLAMLPDLPLPTAGGDARVAKWVPVDELLNGELAVAFDHKTIITDAIERVRGKLEYTTLAAAFCHTEFTMSELRRIYEIVWGQPLDPRNFHRKITKATGFLVPTQRRTTRDGGRPAALYRRGRATLMHPPILRTAQNVRKERKDVTSRPDAYER